MRKIILILTVLSVLALAIMPAQAASGSPSFDWGMAGRIAVQSGGRIKPLDTFARELIKTVYGKSSYHDQHPVETYFRWMSDGDAWSNEPLFYVPKSDMRKLIGLQNERGNYFSMEDLQSRQELSALAMQGAQKENSGGKAAFTETKAAELLNRMGTLSAVFTHNAPALIPVGDDPHAQWQTAPALLDRMEDTTGMAKPLSESESVLALGFAGIYNSVRDDRPDIFNSAAEVFIQTQMEMLADQPATLTRLDWEMRYNYFNPFLWAKVLLWVAAGLYLLSTRAAWSKLKLGGLIVMVGGIALYTLGMGMRAYIAGRAPWSNMYESLLAIGWASVIIALIFELIRRDRLFGTSGAILGGLIIGLAQFASLDRGINPLVPALQSYWLNYHVIITLSGYACLALTMIVGHGVLINAVRSKGQMTPTIAALSKANLRIMQVGSLFLVTGIILGAVWANVSWGRFWGWDPKETWALICWFVYIVFLHGRSAGWLAWRGMAMVSVAAFPIVIMTYYGVNYYLSGLHSYGAGSSPGIPWQVFGYLGLEAAFLGWVAYRLRGTAAPRPVKPNRRAKASATPSEVTS